MRRWPRRLLIGFLILTVATSASFGVLLPQSAHAASMADGFSPDQEATSYSYYIALGGCIQNNMYGDFSSTVAENGNAKPSEWFDDNSAYGFVYPNSTKIDCKDLAAKALTLWGWSNNRDFLSAVNYSYKVDTASGTAGYHGTPDGATRIKNFQSAVQKQVYSSAPSLSAAANYDIDFNGFTLSGGTCAAKDLGRYSGVNATLKKLVDAGSPADASSVKDLPVGTIGSALYAHVSVVDSTTGAMSDHIYVYLASTSTPSRFSANTAQTSQTLFGYHATAKSSTCAGLIKGVNASAPAYSALVVLSTTGDDSQSDAYKCQADPTAAECAKGNTTTCAIDGIGWIICPVITFVAGLADSMFTVLSDNFLKVGVSVVNTDPGKGATTTYKAWQAMQAIANVILVIVFLLIIFSQLTSIGLSNLSVKKMLPKLVIAAILMNVSFFLCQIAVDVSNIAGYSLKVFLTGLAATASSGSGTAINPASGNVLGGTNGWANLAGGILTAGTAITAGYFMLSMLGTLLLAAVVALAMILLILIARQGIIVLAIVTAPVAIALWLLPNTQNVAQLWWKIFSRMLLLFPIISLIFGASTLAAVILRDSFGSFTAANGNVNWLGQIVAAGIQVVPLFATPLVLKGALSVVPGVGALASKWAGRANGNLRKQAREGYRSSVFGRGQAIRKQARQNFRDQRFADRISKGGPSAFAAGGLSNLRWTKGQQAQREAIERAARGTAASAQSEAVKQEMVKLQEKIGTDPDAILRHIQTNHRSMSDTEMQGATDLMLAQAGTAQLRTVMSDPSIMQTHARNVVESARRNESTVRQKAPDLANWAARTEATAGAYGGQTIADTYAKAEAAKLVTLDPAAAEAGEAHINPAEAQRALNDVNASQIKQGTRKVLERLAANAAPSEPMPIPSSAGEAPSSEQVYRNDRGDLSHDSTADYYQAASAEAGGIHNLSDADVQIMHDAAEKWSITDDAGGGTAMTEIGLQALEELKRRGRA